MLLWVMGMGFENVDIFRETKRLQGYSKALWIGI